MSNKNYDYLFKILTVGEFNVGKTSLILRFINDTFIETYMPTIGVDFFYKILDIENKIIAAQIWDFYSSEQFKRLPLGYYRNVLGIIIAYDITEIKSFEKLKNWINDIKMYAHKKVRIVLVGNKYDLSNRKITEEEGKKLADELDAKFFETSAKTGYNVNEAYNFLIRDIFNNYKDFEKNKIEIKNFNVINKKKGCI